MAAMLHSLVHFGLFKSLFVLAFLFAQTFDHAVERILARMRLQPTFARALELALQALDQLGLLHDRLVDAVDELLTVDESAYRQAAVGHAVVAPIALQFFELLFGVREFLLMIGQALQCVFLPTLRLIYRWLQSIRT
jgi:pantoate kinase